MNHSELGGLRWSVSFQHNTYGLHYKLHVVAVKCVTVNASKLGAVTMHVT